MTRIVEAFAVIVDWATSQGAENVSRLPGLWRGETDEYDVRINGHKTAMDDVPPYNILVEHKTAFGRMAMIAPNGGTVIGWTEDDMIRYFRERTPQE